MADIKLIQHGLEQFARQDNWNLPALKNLEKYLLEYEDLPSYRKLLHSMIRYSSMYQPVHYSRKKKIYSPRLARKEWLENTYRAEKRAQIYMNRRNLIRAVDKSGEKRLVVTSTGEKIFYRDYPLAKLREQPWEGVWTIVMYDFPEEKRRHRDKLRYNLEKYGFGSTQLSVYISPLSLAKPIYQLMETEEYQEYVWVTRAESIFGKSSREIASSAWPLGIINDLFRRLSDSFTFVLDDLEMEVFWKVCFLAIDSQNPYLPEELLPEDWQEDDCRKLFKKLSSRSIIDAIFG